MIDMLLMLGVSYLLGKSCAPDDEDKGVSLDKLYTNPPKDSGRGCSPARLATIDTGLGEYIPRDRWKHQKNPDFLNTTFKNCAKCGEISVKGWRGIGAKCWACEKVDAPTMAELNKGLKETAKRDKSLRSSINPLADRQPPKSIRPSGQSPMFPERSSQGLFDLTRKCGSCEGSGHSHFDFSKSCSICTGKGKRDIGSSDPPKPIFSADRPAHPYVQKDVRICGVKSQPFTGHDNTGGFRPYDLG